MSHPPTGETWGENYEVIFRIATGKVPDKGGGSNIFTPEQHGCELHCSPTIHVFKIHVLENFGFGDATQGFYSRMVAKSERRDWKQCGGQGHGTPTESRAAEMLQ